MPRLRAHFVMIRFMLERADEDDVVVLPDRKELIRSRTLAARRGGDLRAQWEGRRLGAYGVGFFGVEALDSNGHPVK